jgi:N-methylhydantoinase A
VGADIGGTFTDIVVICADGRVRTKKVPTTPDDYSRGVASGIAALLDEVDTPPASVRRVVHGTTLGSNAVLEGTGALTALITTAGFRDVLELRRLRRPDLYALTSRWSRATFASKSRSAWGLAAKCGAR